MNCFTFSNLIYYKPHHENKGREILKVIGIDSETYIDGKPFMFCTSLKDCFTLKDIPEIFFTREYRDCHFVVYNLKFDSGSILYNLPIEFLNELRVNGSIIYRDVRYQYIAHKRLRITRNNHGVTFWNVAQFYKCSLQKASEKYLHKHKKELETKSFTREYVKNHFERIKEYCIQDSVLTAELYYYLLEGLKTINVIPTALYSTASLSYQYFRKNTKIEDVWELWCKHRYLLKLASWSYSGGKFEIYKRGKTYGYMYDINSAYPFEMSKLKSIENAKLKCTSKYLKDYDYGFMTCYIDNTVSIDTPVAIRHGYLNIYPAGKYYASITKQEYEYLISNGVNITIKSAFWIKCKREHYPYKNIVHDLFSKKNYYKGKDYRLYNLYKIMLNSFYGKMAQTIAKPDGTIIAGNCWNPIYASIITANTRIRLCELSNKYHKHLVSVHTDSIILEKELPKNMLSDDLGAWQHVKSGDVYNVACGVYQIADKSAFRGFVLDKGIDLKSVLSRAKENTSVMLKSLEVKSWIECAFRNKRHLTNRFITEEKELNFNQDRKRHWPKDVTGQDLLTTLQKSTPLITMQSYKK